MLMVCACVALPTSAVRSDHHDPETEAPATDCKGKTFAWSTMTRKKDGKQFMRCRSSTGRFAKNQCCGAGDIKIKVKVKDSTGKETEHTVDVEVLPSQTEKLEDISVKLSVPIEAVKFEEMHVVDGHLKEKEAKLEEPAAAREAIKSALEAVGMLKTATKGKVCGHGFTVASEESLKSHPEVVEEVTQKRAAKVAQIAQEEAASPEGINNPSISEVESVSHMVHVEIPSAGLIIKLNGAAKEACTTDDWKGPPLP